ncbi:precorrin-6A reductase [Furfurilactobacillus entadae]|uniref:precorrin-6A reductase n=1 Tax=Furfurilactobacillus entadae TaxID=2922307 RepID=UPI0035E61196
MILLIGGTSESLVVADMLTAQHIPFMLSVTTGYGNTLAHQHAQTVVETMFTPETLTTFIKDHHITVIIDASHPFAQVISQLAMTIAAQTAVAYVRYERTHPQLTGDHIVTVTSQAEALAYLAAHDGNVYLSTGSKTAADYATALGVDRLQVRVLPTASVLEKLTTAGFSAHQIDALCGPFSTELNVALFERAAAKILVTKNSGDRGGMSEKVAAAQQLNLTVLIIEAPTLAYPASVADVAALTDFLKGEHAWQDE